MEIHKKILKVMNDLPNVSKDAKGFKGNYADNQAIDKALYPVLKDNGLICRVVQNGEPVFNDDKAYFPIVLTVTDGEESDSVTAYYPIDALQANKEGKKPVELQEHGAMETYATRRMKCAYFGIITSGVEDPDSYDLSKSNYAEKRNEIQKIKASLEEETLLRDKLNINCQTLKDIDRSIVAQIGKKLINAIPTEWGIEGYAKLVDITSNLKNYEAAKKEAGV